MDLEWRKDLVDKEDRIRAYEDQVSMTFRCITCGGNHLANACRWSQDEYCRHKIQQGLDDGSLVDVDKAFIGLFDLPEEPEEVLEEPETVEPPAEQERVVGQPVAKPEKTRGSKPVKRFFPRKRGELKKTAMAPEPHFKFKNVVKKKLGNRMSWVGTCSRCGREYRLGWNEAHWDLEKTTLCHEHRPQKVRAAIPPKVIPGRPEIVKGVLPGQRNMRWLSRCRTCRRQYSISNDQANWTPFKTTCCPDCREQRINNFIQSLEEEAEKLLDQERLERTRDEG